MYSIQMYNLEEIHRGKGIGRAALRKLLHENYKRAIFQPGPNIQMTIIRSQHQQLYTVVVNKKIVHAFSAHRFLLDDKINSLP